MKHKLATLAFAVSVIAITLYGMANPSYDLSLFTDLGAPFVRFRIIVSAILLLYVFVPFLRLKLTQAGMLVAGILFMATGISAIFSPMLFGTFSHYTALGDVMIAIEGGIIAALSALRLETKSLPRLLPQLAAGHYHQQKQFTASSKTV